jgi:hypothetical protein
VAIGLYASMLDQKFLAPAIQIAPAVDADSEPEKETTNKENEPFSEQDRPASTCDVAPKVPPNADAAKT